MSDLQVRKLGVVPYDKALELQTQASRALLERPAGREVLFVLQHHPVITLGRSASREDVLLDDAELARRGLEVVATERGGQATVHSPGQVVLYPILDLRARRLGPARLVELLEEAMIDTCRPFGVSSGRLPPHPGVWVPGDDSKPTRKIGAVGLRITGGVTTHGIALNVANDLTLFEAIVPCGLQDLGVTSLEAETGHPVDPAAVEEALVWAVQSELSEIEIRRTPAPLRPRSRSGSAQRGAGG